MGAEATFTLGDLVQRTRVPATTIHHYQRLGLLPPPDRVALRERLDSGRIPRSDAHRGACTFPGSNRIAHAKH